MGCTDPNAAAEKLPIIAFFHSGEFKERSRENEGGGWFDDDKDFPSLKGVGESKIAGLDFDELSLEALVFTFIGVFSFSLNELNCR